MRRAVTGPVAALLRFAVVMVLLLHVAVPQAAAGRSRFARVADSVPATAVDLDEGITEVTRTLYLRQLDDMAEWCVKLNFGLLRAIAGSTPRIYNAVLKARLQTMVSEGKPPSYGTILVAAFMYRFGWTRGQCGPAWRAVKVWQNTVPISPRVPLDLDVCQAMASLALMWHWPKVACALMVGLRGYLRPGELCALRREHMRLFRRGRRKTLVIAVVRPKTRFRAARVQAVTIMDPVTVSLATAAAGQLRQGELLIAGGSVVITAIFRQLIDALRLVPVGYTPGSLRPGGICADFMTGDLHLTEAMFHGRWESVKSVTRYLQAGMAAWALSFVPQSSAELISRLSALLSSLSYVHADDAQTAPRALGASQLQCLEL